MADRLSIGSRGEVRERQGVGDLVILGLIAFTAQFIQQALETHAALRLSVGFQFFQADVSLSLIKVLAVVLLIVRWARYVREKTEGEADATIERETREAINLLLAVNTLFGLLLLAFMVFINSDQVALIEQAGVSRKAAKIVLLALFVIGAYGLHKRTFSEISKAIGSNFAQRLDARQLARANSRFTRRLGWHALIWCLALYLLHGLWFLAGKATSGVLLIAVAAADGLTVCALGLAAGQAVLLSYRDARATTTA